jgi:hypothetical protein
MMMTSCKNEPLFVSDKAILQYETTSYCNHEGTALIPSFNILYCTAIFGAGLGHKTLKENKDSERKHLEPSQKALPLFKPRKFFLLQTLKKLL